MEIVAELKKKKKLFTFPWRKATDFFSSPTVVLVDSNPVPSLAGSF